MIIIVNDIYYFSNAIPFLKKTDKIRSKKKKKIAESSSFEKDAILTREDGNRKRHGAISALPLAWTNRMSAFPYGQYGDSEIDKTVAYTPPSKTIALLCSARCNEILHLASSSVNSAILRRPWSPPLCPTAHRWKGSGLRAKRLRWWSHHRSEIR